MPSLSINPVSKTKSSSTLLSSDLGSSNTFDIQSTILGSEVTDDNRSAYNLLVTKYSDIYQIDESYNKLVDSLTKSLQEQNRVLEIQADVAAQKQGNIAAEMSAGLSTGAQAIQANELTKARQEASDEISSTINEYATEYAEQVQTSYDSAIEAVLGEKNDEGVYSNIAEYQETADALTVGLVRLIAATMTGNETLYETNESTGETVALDPYKILVDYGLMVNTASGDYELTDEGYARFDQIVNSFQPFGIGSGLTTYDTTDEAAYKIADQACREKYGTTWDTMDSTKKDSIRKNYMDWLSDNGVAFRATNLGLFDYDDDGNIVVDETWSYETEFTDLPANVSVGIDTSGGVISIYSNSINVGTSDSPEYKTTAEYFGETTMKSIYNGSTANGSYIKATDGKYYIYYNGAFYAAKENVVSTTGIPASQIVSSDFGNFFGSNSEDSNQNKYIQAIIEAAKSGKIADDTAINVNYGAGNPYYWIYKDGNFIEYGEKSIVSAKKIIDSYTINNFGATNVSIEDFGSYLGSGTSEQDKYIQAIVDAAKNNTLTNGVYINVNYGAGTPIIWQYKDGKFIKYGARSVLAGNIIKLGSDTTIEYSDVITKDSASKYNITW